MYDVDVPIISKYNYKYSIIILLFNIHTVWRNHEDDGQCM